MYNFTTFISKKSAERMHDDNVKRIIISMTSPNPNGSPAILNDSLWIDILRLEYHDADPQKPKKIKQKVSNKVLFSEDQALQILLFLKKNERSEATEVIAQCEAGISRSAAVAKFVSQIYNLKFPETYSIYNRHVFSTLLTLYGKCSYGEGPIGPDDLPGQSLQ